MAEDVKIYVSETVERVEIKISDPFPANVLPTGTLEINDIKANTLSSVESGGSIPSEIYGWFKAKFTSLVDKLVSSWIHGLLFVTKAIDEALTSLQSTVSEHATSLEVIDGRLDAIDDKLILNYVVPVDTTAINLTVDKNGNAFNFVEGDEITVLLKINQFVGGGANRVNLRINNINDNVYIITNSIFKSIIGAGSSYYGQFTRFKFMVYNGEVHGQVGAAVKTSSSGSWNSNQIYDFATDGLNITRITSLNLCMNNATYLIPAGTVILITKK